MRDTVNHAFNITTMLVAFAIGMVGYWMVEPVTPLATVVKDEILNSSNMPQSTFVAGETVVLKRTWRVKNHVPEIIRTTRLLVDVETGVIVHRESVVPVAPEPGSMTTRYIKMRLPDDLLPKTYAINIQNTIQVNMLREVTYTAVQSPAFRVIK